MLWRILVIVAQFDPCRFHAEVHDPGPFQSIPPIRKSPEVDFFQLFKLLPPRFIGDSFVLHRPLISVGHPSDDESDPGVLPEIPDFSICLDRIEKEFESVGHDKTHDGGLRCERIRYARLDGDRVGAKNVKEVGAGQFILVLPLTPS